MPPYSPTPHLLCGPHPSAGDKQYRRSGQAPLRPGRETLDALLAAGVTCFIDLTEPGEVVSRKQEIGNRKKEAGNRNREQGIRNSEILSPDSPFPIPDSVYYNFPIPDYSIPTPSQMTEILDALDAALASGHTVYLHCHGGRGRTGTVVGCWLVRQGMTGEQALARIAELRGDQESPETDEQRAFVLNWTKSLNAKTLGNKGAKENL